MKHFDFLCHFNVYNVPGLDCFVSTTMFGVLAWSSLFLWTYHHLAEFSRNRQFWKIPALVRISSYSVNLSQDKWHEFKWLEMLSVQSSRQTDSVKLHLSKYHTFLYTSINWTKSTLTPSLLIYGSSRNVNKLLINIWRLH